ncbi:MAG: hypothetical protein AB1898_27650, partial [Acidobacteriota bacterium]
TEFAVMAWGSASPDAQQLQWMKEAGLNIAGFGRVKDVPAYERVTGREEPSGREVDWIAPGGGTSFAWTNRNPEFRHPSPGKAALAHYQFAELDLRNSQIPTVQSDISTDCRATVEPAGLDWISD